MRTKQFFLKLHLGAIVKLAKKLIVDASTFINLKKFIVFQVAIIAVVIIALLKLDGTLQSNFAVVTGIPALILLEFSILNDMWGKFLFNDRHKWPAQFLHWEVIDASNCNNQELIDAVFWCRDNCKKNSWRQTKNNWFLFKKKDDALLFRLTW